jgi:D-arabinose 1-dehydrogenase-like Zn-dependent alcohol dehydrogenase
VCYASGLRYYYHTHCTTLQQTLDLILNTISADHDVMLYQPLLRPNATIVCLGLVQTPHKIPQVALLMNRNAIAGSLIGGVKRTQEIVDLCEEKKIYPDVVVVDCNKVDDIFEELQGKSTTVQRYVMDIANTLQDFTTSHSKVSCCA